MKQKIEEFHEILKESSEFEIEYRNGWDFAEQEIRIYTLNLYSNSLFISLYSFLERKLYQICKVAEKNKSIKINDLSGDGIFKYCNYLKKVLEIDLEKINSEWVRITNYNKLRNRIVHSPTNIIEKDKNNKKLIEAIKSIEYLVINDKGAFIEFEINNQKLLLNFLNSITNFLDFIYWENPLK
ncbi:MAG: hypothetical protein SH857_00725 [Chitinophagales bacterium]|nr:hypothetical protein [Chitinophagales bacterium]